MNGRLPSDPKGRRVGEPDVLVRFGAEPLEGRWRYVPVDVKHHRALVIGGPDGVPTDVSELADPSWERRSRPVGWFLKKSEKDALQLAHYFRMLQACGHAVERQDFEEIPAGIIGTEEKIVWYDLRQGLFRSGSGFNGDELKRTQSYRSALERYDFEFGFRLDIVDAADEGRQIVEPIFSSECGSCPWRENCVPQLEEDRDVSLLTPIRYASWRALRTIGITSIDDLVEKLDVPEIGLYPVYSRQQLMTQVDSR